MTKFVRNIGVAVLGILLCAAGAFALPATITQGCPGPNCIVGVEVMQLDTPMASGRVYGTIEMQRVVETWRGKKVRGTIIVDDYASEGNAVNYSPIVFDQSSHIASNLRVLGNSLVCDIEVMNTMPGKVLAELLKLGMADFKMYGVGNTRTDGQVEEFELVRIDVYPN